MCLMYHFVCVRAARSPPVHCIAIHLEDAVCGCQAYMRIGRNFSMVCETCHQTWGTLVALPNAATNFELVNLRCDMRVIRNSSTISPSHGSRQHKGGCLASDMFLRLNQVMAVHGSFSGQISAHIQNYVSVVTKTTRSRLCSCTFQFESAQKWLSHAAM